MLELTDLKDRTPPILRRQLRGHGGHAPLSTGQNMKHLPVRHLDGSFRHQRGRSRKATESDRAVPLAERTVAELTVMCKHDAAPCQSSLILTSEWVVQFHSGTNGVLGRRLVVEGHLVSGDRTDWGKAKSQTIRKVWVGRKSIVSRGVAHLTFHDWRVIRQTEIPAHREGNRQCANHQNEQQKVQAISSHHRPPGASIPCRMTAPCRRRRLATSAPSTTRRGPTTRRKRLSVSPRSGTSGTLPG